jgi:hypothetical protein
MLRRSPFHVYVLRHKNNEHYQKMNKIAVRGRKREVTLGCCVQNFNEWGDLGDLLPTLPRENKCRYGFSVLGKYSD